MRAKASAAGANITAHKLGDEAVTFPQSRLLQMAIVPILHGHKLTLCELARYVC